ncbi:MAG: hypothetical protein AB7I42_24275 [Bradyrhizobium sp.]|uniref:hypothetical protein n=1 Tax=Bradyrhizobium sp. TaxID=376 RepID=UPI003D0E0E4E
MPQYSVSKPGGTLIIMDECGNVVEADTLTCCHCGRVWQHRKGSGIARGFCRKCMKPHCGDADCWECYPIAQRIDDYEKGKRLVI